VDEDGDTGAALETIERLVREAVTRVLASAGRTGVTPMQAALDEARAYLVEATAAEPDLLDELFGAPDR
jgi:hypothetical protein